MVGFRKFGGLLAATLLLPALAQLLVRRFVDPAAPLATLVALAGGVACHFGGNGNVTAVSERPIATPSDAATAT